MLCVFEQLLAIRNCLFLAIVEMLCRNEISGGNFGRDWRKEVIAEGLKSKKRWQQEGEVAGEREIWRGGGTRKRGKKELSRIRKQKVEKRKL